MYVCVSVCACVFAYISVYLFMCSMLFALFLKKIFSKE